MDFSTSNLWTGPFPTEGASSYFILLPCSTVIPVVNANSVDPDQMPSSAVSDPGPHCLPISILRDTMRKWVKEKQTCIYDRNKKGIFL